MHLQLATWSPEELSQDELKTCGLSCWDLLEERK